MEGPERKPQMAKARFWLSAPNSRQAFPELEQPLEKAFCTM